MIITGTSPHKEMKIPKETLIERLIECSQRYKDDEVYRSGLEIDINYYINEYTEQFQPNPVDVDKLNDLRNKFFEQMTDDYLSHDPKVVASPKDVFNWFLSNAGEVNKTDKI